MKACAAAVFGVVMALVGGCSRSAEQSARDEVRRLGGTVRTDDGDRVVAVDLASAADDDHIDVIRPEHLVNGRTFDRLRDLRHLESLRVAGRLIDDNDLTHLHDFPALRSLDLKKTNVTDAGLASLGRLPGLRQLNLERLDITDRGLAVLAAECPRLEEVNLKRTKVTDAGVKAFQDKLPKCSITR